MIIYDRLRVIDGDTIEIRLWPSNEFVVLRIEELDTDEKDTARGVKQTRILERFAMALLGPYIRVRKDRIRRGKTAGWRYKRCRNGRLICAVYVWHRWRYVNYAAYMKRKRWVKRGSKWND